MVCRWSHVRFPVALALALGLAFATVAPAHAATRPEAGLDHWHAAFGIWNCGTWQPPVTSAEDPTGVHTHGDGLIHIHPFDEKAAGKNAILQRFFDVTGVSVTKAAVTIQGRPTIKEGGTCQGEKTVIRTLVWSIVKTKTPKVITVDAGLIALAEGQVIAVVIGGQRANSGQPPSAADLLDPGDLPLPDLTAKELAALPALPSKPKFVPSGTAPTTLQKSDIIVGTGAELTNGLRAYMRYSAYLWRTGEVVSEDWSATAQPSALARLGRGRNLPGIDHAMVGMKVGGVRRIVMPPAEAFGSAGNGPVKGTDTLVFIVQLVAVAK